jgi:hypothetical protein
MNSNHGLCTSAILAAIALGSCSSAGTGASPAAGMSAAGALQQASLRSVADVAFPSTRIYVANTYNDTITTYLVDGTQTTPTIATDDSNDNLLGVAVGANGKIYALNLDPQNPPASRYTVTAYEADGTPTTPTIDIALEGYNFPRGIAVDKNGKIYVLRSAHDGLPGTVRTYNPDGTRTTPTIKAGGDSGNMTVDQNGKIYVANDVGVGSITTYNPDGTPATPTITNNSGGDGMAATYVTTYAPNGSGPGLRFRVGAGGAAGIVLGPNGKFYLPISSAYITQVNSYDLDGTRKPPTITAGIGEPSGIAIH